ncbi:MAG: tRNA lysidine(34) synthetase TilS [Phycisphaerales bacterium]|nr:MAG: tRNA lysidine(34) synthetase TilS [Phycisphaerales bacterium]
MLSEFEKKVACFVEQHELFGSAQKVILSVSGGADSTALLYAMQALKAERLLGAEVLCAHINHQLRAAEADLDETFVLSRAALLNLASAVKHVDVRGFARQNKLSIETAGRELRIRTLAEIARANHAELIATAHHKNDNAETVLHRLARGTGFRGLGGIWPARVFADGVTFIRPLLSVTRDEILGYLQERNLQWRRDHTNTDCTYRRNYIRHRLLPALQRDCTGSVVEQLSELARRARGVQDLVSRRVDHLWPDLADCRGEHITLDSTAFRAQPHPVQVELVRRSLTCIGCGERGLTLRHYDRILSLAQPDGTGNRTELPGGFVVEREHGNLTFARSEKAILCTEPVRLNIPGRTSFGQCTAEAKILESGDIDLDEFISCKTDHVERFDSEKLRLPLTVRSRQAGDRFVPLGLASEKKLGKFLTAQYVPHRIRTRVLVVRDMEKIIWVWPVRISERAKVSPQTRRVLQLRITDIDDETRIAQPLTKFD